MAEDSDFAPLPPKPTNWDELFAITGGLAHIPITEIERGRVDHKYEFDAKDLRPCGRDHCERPHSHGWLVALPGRRFVHIGKDCAKKYANKELWTSKLGAYNARVTSEYRNKALAEARDVAQQKQHWLDNTPAIQATISLYDSFVGQVKGGLLDEIEKRAERGRPIIELEVRLSDEQIEAQRAMGAEVLGDGRTVHTHVAAFEKVQVGTIAGLNCFRPGGTPRELRDRLQRHVSTLLSWFPAEGDIDSARDLSRSTRELGPISNRLQSCLVEAERFFAASNLAILMKLPAAKSQGFLSIELDNAGGVRVLRRPHWDRAA